MLFGIKNHGTAWRKNKNKKLPLLKCEHVKLVGFNDRTTVFFNTLNFGSFYGVNASSAPERNSGKMELVFPGILR